MLKSLAENPHSGDLGFLLIFHWTEAAGRFQDHIAQLYSEEGIRKGTVSVFSFKTSWSAYYSCWDPIPAVKKQILLTIVNSLRTFSCGMRRTQFSFMKGQRYARVWEETAKCWEAHGRDAREKRACGVMCEFPQEKRLLKKIPFLR